jgi:glutamate carboxypeptidase
LVTAELRKFLTDHQDEMLADLRAFVEMESPSDDKYLLDRFATFLADYASASGACYELIEAQQNGNHLLARWGPGERKPILLIGHYDTVWPSGTLEERPFGVRGGAAWGPGIFDMKCGLVQGFWAMRALHAISPLEHDVLFLCNSDEEIGSISSRELIGQTAGEATAVLVLEPSLDGD